MKVGRPRQFSSHLSSEKRLERDELQFAMLLDPAAQSLGYPNAVAMMLPAVAMPEATGRPELQRRLLQLSERQATMYRKKYGREPPTTPREVSLRRLESSSNPVAQQIGAIFRQVANQER